MKIRQLPLPAAIAILFVTGPASADWKAGEAAYARGDYEAAALEFVKYVENEPRDPRYAGAYFRLGSCYLHLERLDEAEVKLRMAVELDPSKLDYRLTLGQCLGNAGSWPEAHEVFEAINAAEVPEDQRTPVALMRANAALKSSNQTRAVEVLETRIAEAEKSPELHRAFGVALEKSGSRERAVEAYAHAFTLDPTDTTSGRRAVNLALDLGEDMSTPEDKLAWSERGVELADVLVTASRNRETLNLASEASYSLGRTLDFQGLDERAVAALNSALQYQPEADLARRTHRKLAKIHARNLDLEEAATHFGAAGDDATAAQIREIETSFADALEERKELVSTIAQLEIMAQKVEELNDAKGVRAIRDRITGFQVNLDELEENLAEVRQALARL